MDINESLKNYEGEDRMVTATEYLALKVPKKKAVFCSTGIPKLSELLNGFSVGEVFVIMGYTGFGKTLLANSLNYDFLYQGKKTAFFSYEVDPSGLVPDEQDLKDEFLHFPLTLKSMDLHWLKARILEAKLKYGVEIVFIDHLHYIIDMSLKQNMSLNIGAAMRFIQYEIARCLDVLVFLLAHTTQPKKGETPTLGDARDSSFITQEPDGVLVIHREPDSIDSKYAREFPTYNNGNATLTIEKARRSGTYKARIQLVKEGRYLKERQLLPS